MAEPSAIRAGRAFVELFADDSKLVRGLRTAQKKIKAFGDSIRNMGLKLTGLGSALAAPLLGATKMFGDLGSRLWDMSKRTGISVEALSGLGYAAEQSGAGMESLENGIRRMQRTIHDAGRGLSTAVDALGELGLTARDLEKLSPEAQFKLLADRLDQIKNPTRKAALALMIFGRSGTALLPMLEGGAAALDAYEKQARKLGLVMSTQDAQGADALGDALDDLWKVLKMSAFTIGSALAPAFLKVSRIITSVTVGINGWIRRNKDLVVTLLKVAVSIIAVGGGLVILGTAVSTMGTALGGLATIVVAAGSAMGVLLSVVGALVTPVGAAIASIMVLGATLIHVTGAGGMAMDWLSERFKALADFAISTFDGIADALAAGEIALAARVLWLSLQLAWQKGIAVLVSLWENLKVAATKAAIDLWYGVQAAFEIGIASVTEGMTRLYYDLMGVWERLSTGVRNIWDSTINWVAKRLVDLWGLVDDSIDTTAVKDQLEKDVQNRIGERNAARDVQLKQLTGERDEALGMLGAQHRRKLAQIGQASIDAQGQLDDESKKRIDASQAQLDEARREWREALDSARQKREAKGPDDASGPANVDDYIGKVRAALADLGDVGQLIGDEAARFEARGTFNAQALWGFGADDEAANRTAKATEQTVKFVRRIATNTERGPATFE
jgi:hypothetical protein